MISSTEYYYLKRPFFSDSIDLIKITLKDLCFREVLDVEVKTYKRKNRKDVNLVIFKRGNKYFQYEPTLKFEEIVLTPFRKYDNIRFPVLKAYFIKKIGKYVRGYKKEYVYPEIKEKALCENTFFQR